MTGFRKILCPIDLNPVSESAFPMAVSIAEKYGGEILLVHVVDDSFPYPDAFSWANPSADFYKTLREKAREIMGELDRTHNRGKVPVQYVVLKGKPHEEIVALAKERKIDLIVLSTHGRKGFDSALMGSQAVKIIRQAACPVLAVKPPPDPED
jgi:nucleotide-binding universal stress UspA family protein